MKKLNIFSLSTFLSVLFVFASCTDLEYINESSIIPDESSAAGGDPAELLASTYGQLREFANERTIFALSDHSSDELLGPTRGTDWSDNGVFKSIHSHGWAPDHLFIETAWNNLNTGVFRATQALASSPTSEQEAQLKVLRAFYMFHIVDFWGIQPFREADEGVDVDPRVLSAAEAVDLMVSDLESAIDNLPATSSVSVVNQSTARALLAKVLLNKAVFTSDDRSTASFKFESGDMDRVIALADDIIASGQYSLTAGLEGYFNTFAQANDTESSELIFAVPPTELADYKRRWNMTLHYNQTPGGWNGFTTLGEFYDSFEADDVRFGGPYNSASNPFTATTGTNVGFLLGQQFDAAGNELTTRGGEPLSFTREIQLNGNSEEKGIRVVKVVPDFSGGVDNTNDPSNHFVLLRYADVLFMKAEAIFRGGSSSESAEDIITEVRQARGLSSISVDETSLLAERGREFYWEGWRRNDLVRFGKFLEPWHLKEPSGAERVLFTIPGTAIASNPNLTQNKGY